jgi:hypothetical protein
MPASKDSKFRGKRARQFREAQMTSFKRDRQNDAPRNANLGPYFGHYLPPLDRRSGVDADEIAWGLNSHVADICAAFREHKALGNDD